MSFKTFTGTLLPDVPAVDAAPDQIPFFVTGLPRSRTAWLANFLTAQGALCMHEGLLHGVDMALRWLIRGGAPGRRGLSDSILPLYWPQISKPFGDCRLVIVERDPAECWISLLDYLEKHEVQVHRPTLEERFVLIKSHLTDMKMFSPHIVVRFEDLGNLGVLSDIWEHCLPGLPFDADRAALLQRLNVQQQLSAVRAATL